MRGQQARKLGIVFMMRMSAGSQIGDRKDPAAARGLRHRADAVAACFSKILTFAGFAEDHLVHAIGGLRIQERRDAWKPTSLPIAPAWGAPVTK